MSQQPQQQPSSQSQGSQQISPRSQSQPKKPRHPTKGFWDRLSGENRVAIIVAIIGAVSVILAATIPVAIQLVKTSSISKGLPSPATITPSLSSNVYPPVGWKLVYSDPMKSNSSAYWPVKSEAKGGCTFNNDIYQVSAKSDWSYHCINNNTDFINFAFEAQMMIAKGDEGGILFRANADTGTYYFFWINPVGTYGIEIYENGEYWDSLGSGSSEAIHSGLNQPNTIAAEAQGNAFKLYINKELIDTVTDKDSSFGHGSIGLFVYSINSPTEVLFSNVKVWTPGS